MKKKKNNKNKEGKLDITHFTMIISENTASIQLACEILSILSSMLSKINIFMKSIYSYIQEITRAKEFKNLCLQII